MIDSMGGRNTFLSQEESGDQENNSGLRDRSTEKNQFMTMENSASRDIGEGNDENDSLLDR